MARFRCTRRKLLWRGSFRRFSEPFFTSYLLKNHLQGAWPPPARFERIGRPFAEPGSVRTTTCPGKCAVVSYPIIGVPLASGQCRVQVIASTYSGTSLHAFSLRIEPARTANQVTRAFRWQPVLWDSSRNEKARNQQPRGLVTATKHSTGGDASGTTHRDLYRATSNCLVKTIQGTNFPVRVWSALAFGGRVDPWQRTQIRRNAFQRFWPNPAHAPQVVVIAKRTVGRAIFNDPSRQRFTHVRQQQ